MHFELRGQGDNSSVFWLDDLRDLYAVAFHSYDFGEEKHYAALNAVLNPVRCILRSHPTLARVMSPIIGRDDFWMQILGSGSSTSLTDLTAGLMARADELPGDGFRKAATELNAFLVTGGEDKTAVCRATWTSIRRGAVSRSEFERKIRNWDDMTIVPLRAGAGIRRRECAGGGCTDCHQIQRLAVGRGRGEAVPMEAGVPADGLRKKL